MRRGQNVQDGCVATVGQGGGICRSQHVENAAVSAVGQRGGMVRQLNRLVGVPQCRGRSRCQDPRELRYRLNPVGLQADGFS